MPKSILAAQLGESGDHVRAPHQKTDARARDVEGLGEGEELDAHLERTGVRQERTAGGTVEHDVGIGVVVHDEQVVLTGERDDLVVQGVVTHRAHGVGGKRHDHVLGAVGNLGIDAGDIR